MAEVTAGKWHKIVFHCRWASRNAEFHKLGYIGKKLLEERKINTTIEDDRYFSSRVGLHANGQCGDMQIKWAQGTRSVRVESG